MQTASFSDVFSNPKAVAITRKAPGHFKGRVYQDLAPSWPTLKKGMAGDAEGYDREMSAHLNTLNARKVLADLGPDAILVCYEPFNTRCHRRMVAEWLEEWLQIEIPELGHKRAESLPYAKLPRHVKKGRFATKAATSKPSTKKSLKEKSLF